MKTLILNGSPRPNGDTASLIATLRRHLVGEIIQVNCYTANIVACIDCRHCMTAPGCTLCDGMQLVYDAIETSDCIVIATPIYFSLPTPPLMTVGSRLQPYYGAILRGEQPLRRGRRGGILLAGGGNGAPDPAEATARRLLRAMGANVIGPTVASLHTDTLPASDDAEAHTQARVLANFLNDLK